MFAIQHYDNPQSVTVDDFMEDMKKFKYLKRLLKRYLKTGVLRVNLILNHLIILFNVFDEAAIPLLFYHLEEDLWPSIKSFLVFLKRIPEYPKSDITGIPVDDKCLEELNSL